MLLFCFMKLTAKNYGGRRVQTRCKRTNAPTSSCHVFLQENVPQSCFWWGAVARCRCCESRDNWGGTAVYLFTTKKGWKLQCCAKVFSHVSVLHVLLPNKNTFWLLKWSWTRYSVWFSFGPLFKHLLTFYSFSVQHLTIVRDSLNPF